MYRDNNMWYRGYESVDGTGGKRMIFEEKKSSFPHALKDALASLDALHRCVCYEENMGRIDAAKSAIKDIVDI